MDYTYTLTHLLTHSLTHLPITRQELFTTGMMKMGRGGEMGKKDAGRGEET